MLGETPLQTSWFVLVFIVLCLWYDKQTEITPKVLEETPVHAAAPHMQVFPHTQALRGC